MPIPMFDVALDELKEHKHSLTCFRLACRPPHSQSLQGRRNHRGGALPRWPRRSDDPNSLYKQIGVLSISLTQSHLLRRPSRPRTERPVPGGSFGSESSATVDLQGETVIPWTNDLTVSVPIRALVRLTCTLISGFVLAGSDEATMLRPQSLPGGAEPAILRSKFMRASTELDSLVDQPPQSVHIS
jgi:hypothetical protein